MRSGKQMKTRQFTIELRIGNEETYEVVEMKKLNGETEKSIAKALEKCIAKH